MAIHVTPIPSTIELAEPAFVLGVTNEAGAAVTATATNSTLLAFDTSAPATVGGSSVVGSATVASRRDHVHIGVSPGAAVFSGNVDLGSNILVGNGGSTGIAISAAGEVNMAAQPAFLAYNSATDSNVTGAGTIVTVDLNTEVFDQGGDFASNTFTAPVTGRYCLAGAVNLEGITTNGTQISITFVTSNRNVRKTALTHGTAGSWGQVLAVVVDMDATDTAILTIRGEGESSDVQDVSGQANLITYFSGYLVA